MLPAEGGDATMVNGGCCQRVLVALPAEGGDAMLEHGAAASGGATTGHQSCYHGPSAVLPCAIDSAIVRH
jgi:hypothetical protein